MSTGDQTEYIRGKLAQRGTSQATFMRDGFDRWAESEAPARAGQMEKIPAETQMAGRGGAMTVRQAKKYDAQYNGGRAAMIKSFKGGRSFLGVEVPKIVEDAITYGEKLLEFAALVDKKLPEIERAMQEEIIDNNDDPSISDTDRKIAREFLPLIQRLKGYFNTLKTIKKYADDIKSIVGAGRNGRMHGGATATENFNKFVDFLKKAYTTVKKYVDWILTYGKFIVKMLALPPLQPVGNQILDKVKPILSLVGLGRHRCGCDDGDSSEEECMRGGAYGMFGEELYEPVMMSSTEMVPYSGKAPAGQSYGSLGMDYSRAQPPSKVQYSPPPSKDLPMDYSRGVAPSDSTRTSKGGRRCGGAMEMMEEMVLADPTSEIVAKFRQYMQRLKENVASGKITREEAKRLADEAKRGLDKTLAKLKKGGVTSFKPSISSSKGRRVGGAFSSMDYGVAQSPGGMEEEFYDDSNGMKEYGVNLAPSTKAMSKAEMRREKEQFMANKGFPMDLPKNSGFAMNSGFPMNSGFAMSVPNSNKGGKKSSARGAIVKKVMREKGLSLPQASKYVKEHGLY